MNIRHGDMALIRVTELPTGLTPSTANILLTGSGGNPHTFAGGNFYPHQDGQIVGYLVADDGCTLYHPDHGKVIKGKALREASVPADIYAVHRQVEDTHEGMRVVED